MRENLTHKLLLEEFPRILSNNNLSTFIKNQVKTILDCRTLNLGGHIFICPDEPGGLFHYNSCRKRGCSVCMEYEQRKWFAKKKPLLFPVKHQHLIFKIPGQLTYTWLYNKLLIQKIMFKAAHAAIKKVNGVDVLKRGWISVLHTWGGDLSYHSHIHTLITNGGLDEHSHWQEDGLFVNRIRTYYTKIIRKKMLKALNKNEFCLPPGMGFNELAKIIKIKCFNIQQFGTNDNGKGVLKYLSNKLKVGAINHRQVTAYDEKTVTFNYKRDEKTETITLSREEFIRRYLNHIPPKGFMMVRSCGIYSALAIKLKRHDFTEHIILI